MKANSVPESFVHELSRALSHLYDPGVLRRSSLAQFLGISRQADAISALRRMLTDAIGALKPNDSVPPGANAWRLYHILYYRYVEQFKQRDVAIDLALSVRQLRRQEKVAVQVLADYLWTQYDLGHKAHLLRPSSQIDDQVVLRNASVSAGTPSRDEELAWLEKTVPSEPIDVRELLQATLETVRPLARTLDVSVECSVPDNLPPVNVQLTTMRQSLLHLVTTAARYIPGGRVELSAEVLTRRTGIRILVVAQGIVSPLVNERGGENLDIARKLVCISGGSLELALDASAKVPFTARIVLPTAEQVPVLVIDDNVDTLRLLQRYLSGSRYRFAGTSSPKEALRLAEQLVPQMIVLDVMLPELDGWELLGRLREHPKTCDVPIIVCTILPQEQLALTLGAAEFIQKPVSRNSLLTALDRQMERLLRGPGQSS
jgi:CheY-like chemotaxis protein